MAWRIDPTVRFWGSLLILGLANSAWAANAFAAELLFADRERTSEQELDGIRGGFALPNGMDVSIGIEITTLVNGALALRTVLASGGTGTPSVFVGSGGTSATASAGGTTLSNGNVVRVVNGDVQQPTALAGQELVELNPNGPAVATASGAIKLAQSDRGSTVVLSGASLELRHMVGDFTGSLVANAGNNRAIDTVVTVNVGLPNSSIPVGNAMLRLESIFVDAASRAIR
ncbi:hypothetical protein [Sphingomonas sp. DBB INV C78]|uniref:hypothetical protein n=1 Tax=Sphingomonas sp. DBB INV C78 TaxID=3349434 RepID=UPI0036D429B9